MSKYILLVLLLFFTAETFFAGTPLVVLHTNDTHSQLEPYGKEDKYNAGKAGIVRREAVYREIRAKEPNVICLDAGDFVQGTPYFNLFKGDAEIKLMNRLKLDAVTLGNHEFDNGVAFLAKMLSKARFPIVSTNYDVASTPLKKVVRPWLVVKRGNLRIGIVSANIRPDGLISEANFKGIRYLEPYQTADSVAQWLKSVKKCNLVVCLSHLGYDNKGESPDDLQMAQKTSYLDVIIGGHTHTFLKKPELRLNSKGDTVVINQVGKGGIYVGRLDLDVE